MFGWQVLQYKGSAVYAHGTGHRIALAASCGTGLCAWYAMMQWQKAWGPKYGCRCCMGAAVLQLQRIAACPPAMQGCRVPYGKRVDMLACRAGTHLTAPEMPSTRPVVSSLPAVAIPRIRPPRAAWAGVKDRSVMPAKEMGH